MRYTLRVLGIAVATLDVDVFEEEAAADCVLGGSSHDFERDSNPLSPTHHHEWEWEDKGRFGFS